MKSGIDPCKEKKKQNIDKRGDLRAIEKCGKLASKVQKLISENKQREALR